MMLFSSVLVKGDRLGMESYLTFLSSRLPCDGVNGSERVVLLLHLGDFGVGESQFDQSSSKSLMGAARDRGLDFFTGSGVFEDE
jgi:hypothetical protein